MSLLEVLTRDRKERTVLETCKAFIMGDVPFSSCFEELVPARPIEHLGKIDMSFNGKLPSPLIINEDGGESGCGGKVWIAGELLCEYILEKSDKEHLLSHLFPDGNCNSVLELGSGTGLVGLCVGLMDQANEYSDREVYISDIDQLLGLMESNIQVNGLDDKVHAEVLWWGNPLPDVFVKKPVDLVLAADCVYLEAAFPLLEKTLLELTDGENVPIILMAYKKRRKADKHFFQKIKKNFKIVEIRDFINFDKYLKQRTHLFQLMREK
ncbi:putative protein-lysine N-methyltransferase [Kluyveromyces lactis]|uniref:Protein-lysine N-methyltransferase EFM6 n=1 Tax=Kluyveromyces lactis (strain ATCC 8585 / CBS 2359 / DSM 70799 / NBRC 1267 / NRRL Y-1140 / WM37) TaxID=284590 RepID=Q6CP15_KLULA|nr:uncharacterized protein KLLA0_E08295g [Kluyveromyces lactis]CAG99411.1 KLLA0E08295p [Kluyveromyces lactis]|eukprot:XP_454324.1 uncharacterized protein KLLA0_E08295g [Kluyveromyces lactis]